MGCTAAGAMITSVLFEFARTSERGQFKVVNLYLSMRKHICIEEALRSKHRVQCSRAPRQLNRPQSGRSSGNNCCTIDRVHNTVEAQKHSDDGIKDPLCKPNDSARLGVCAIVDGIKCRCTKEGIKRTCVAGFKCLRAITDR